MLPQFQLKHEVTVKVWICSDDGINWRMSEDGKKQFEEQIRAQIKDMYSKGGK